MRARDWPPVDVSRIREIVSAARGRGDVALLEPNARGILEAMGVAVPRAVFLAADESDADAFGADGPARAASTLDGYRVVVRVVAPAIAHKTDVGGVAVVAREPAAIAEAIAGMRGRLAGLDVSGFLVAEYVDHDSGLGGSLLISARWTDDVGPIVSVGSGGIDAEALAADLRPGREIAILSPSFTRREEIAEVLNPEPRETEDRLRKADGFCCRHEGSAEEDGEQQDWRADVRVDAMRDTVDQHGRCESSHDEIQVISPGGEDGREREPSERSSHGRVGWPCPLVVWLHCQLPPSRPLP